MTQQITDFFVEKLGVFNTPKLLIVEGKDDRWFFGRILHEFGASPNDVGVFEIGGKEQLDRQFSLFLKSRAMVEGRVTRYAIVRDADAEPSDAVEAVHTVLSRHSQPLPEHGNHIVSSGGIGVGLFIVPSLSEPGDLERLCFNTIADTQHGDMVLKFFHDVEAQFGHLDHVSKRQTGIYLNTRLGERCNGAGRGFVLGHFNDSHPALDAIRNFLREFLSL